MDGDLEFPNHRPSLRRQLSDFDRDAQILRGCRNAAAGLAGKLHLIFFVAQTLSAVTAHKFSRSISFAGLQSLLRSFAVAPQF